MGARLHQRREQARTGNRVTTAVVVECVTDSRRSPAPRLRSLRPLISNSPWGALPPRARHGCEGASARRGGGTTPTRACCGRGSSGAAGCPSSSAPSNLPVSLSGGDHPPPGVPPLWHGVPPPPPSRPLTWRGRARWPLPAHNRRHGHGRLPPPTTFCWPCPSPRRQVEAPAR